MRKFLNSIILFIPFAIVLYIVMVFIWGLIIPQLVKKNINYRLGTYGHMFTRLQEADTTNEIDILVLGSSHAYRGIDPRIFKKAGYTLFNLGSSNQTPIQSEILLHRYIKKLKPKLVIIEVNPLFFANDGVESSVDIIANAKNDLSTLKMAFTINNVKTYNTLIYGILRDIFGLNSSFKESHKKDDDTYIAGGFVERKSEKHIPLSITPTPQPAFEYQNNAFNNIVAFLNKKNTPFLLIQTPVTKDLYKTYKNSSQFDDRMKKYGTYLNYNPNSILNDTLHFYDPDHLNQNGVMIFNSILIDFINSKIPQLSRN